MPEDDGRYVKSNYALVKDLDSKEQRTPAPDRARYADESAITAARSAIGGLGGSVDPMTVSELRQSVRPTRGEASPHDDYEKEMLRRERMERNR